MIARELRYSLVQHTGIMLNQASILFRYGGVIFAQATAVWQSSEKMLDRHKSIKERL